MKKNTIKAFTLVEMLIVIVIIGILIASLMPRMQTAQGRARDVARKNDLSQIQTAIITSQSDRGKWPGMDGARAWISVDTIKQELLDAGMSEVPSDPNGSNTVSWLWDTTGSWWQYMYIVWKRNWVEDAWFVLMAKTEVEWSSNWVTCGSATDLSDGKIVDDNGVDYSTINLCRTITKVDSTENCTSNTEDCTYHEAAELRYILLY